MATFTVNVDVNSKSVNELEQDLQGLEAQFKQLKIGDPGFTELGRQIQGIRSQLKDVELQFEGLDKEQRATALVDTFNGLTGAVGAVSSAFIAFGSSSEAIEEAEKKLLGVIGVVSGLRDVSNGLISAGKLFGPTFSKIGDSISGAFSTGSTAAKGFKAALASIGIGLLITAVATLITNFDDLKAAFGGTSKEADEFNKEQQETQKQLQKTAEEARITAQLGINELQNSFNNVSQAGGDASTVLTDIQKQLPELANLNLQAAGAQDKVNEALNRYATLSDLNVQRQNNLNKLKEEEIALGEAVDAKLAATTKADKEFYANRIQGSNAAINAIRNENKELDIQIAKIQTQRAAEIKAVEDEKKRQAEAETARKQAEANRKDATAKEIKAAKDKNEALRKLDEERATEGLDAITTQFANNLARLKEQQAEELKQANLTEKAKADIKAKYNALIQVNELQRIEAVDKLQKEEATKQLEAAQKAIDDLKAFREKALTDELAGFEQYYKDRDDLLATALAKGEITQEEYDKKREQNEIAKLENLKQILKDAGKSTIEVERQIAEARKAIREADSKDAMEKAFATAQFAVESASQLNSALQTFAQARTNNQRTEIEKQIQAEVDLANARGATQEEIEKIKIEGDKKLSEAAKQAFEEQKKYQIAQAILDGGSAILSIFANAAANPSTVLFPGYPYVQAGIAAIFTAAKIKQIKSTTFSGGGGGSGAAGGNAGQASVPTAPTPTVNTTPLLPQGPTTIGSGQATATTGQGLGERIIKTYVLSGDVTDAQEAEARINQRRQF